MSIHKTFYSSTEQHLTVEQVQRYQAGKMTASEMHRVEKHLVACEFCSDAVEGMAMLSPEENALALDELRATLQHKSSSSRRGIYWQWKIAASVVLVLLSLSTLFVIQNLQSDDTAAVAIKIPVSKSKPVSPEATRKEQVPDTLAATEAMALSEDKVEEETAEVSTRDKAAQTESNPPKKASKETNNNVIDTDLLALEEMELDTLPVLQEDKIELFDASKAKSKNAQRAQATATVPQVEIVAPKPAARSNITGSVATISGRRITGQVVDETDGSPIPGVNVMIKQTGSGAVTDMAGRFTLSAPLEEVVLNINFVGFISKEIPVRKEQQHLDVKLAPDVLALSEVVVQGYGEATKAEDTFSKSVPSVGMRKYKAYLKANTRYPQSAIEHKIKGTVRLKFVVNTDGSLSDIRVVKSLGHGLDEEAKRLLLSGPRWNPATKNNIPLKQEVKLSIPFNARELSK